MSSSYFYRCRGQARELAMVQAMRSSWFKRHFSRDTLHLQAVSRRDGLYVRLDPDHAGNPNGDYAQWIMPADRVLGDKAHPFKLVISTPTANSARGIRVAEDGKLSSFYYDDMGARGGSGDSLSPDALKKLDEMLTALSEEKAIRPPEGRPLVFQTFSGGHPITRIYDRADAPDLIWDIVRLCHGEVAPWFPEVQPQTVFSSTNSGDGFFCLNPAGDQLILGQGQSIQIWDLTTHEFLRSIPANIGGNGNMVFSPDGKTAVLTTQEDTICFDSSTWKEIIRLYASAEMTVPNSHPLSHPQFTHDGRYLLLWWDRGPLMQIFDTSTWQKVPNLPEVPATTLQYILSSSGDYAIIQSNLPSVELWKVGKNEKIATLSENARESRVSFSPDGSMVAVAIAQTTGADKDTHLRIWSTATGGLIREFSPYQLPVPVAVLALGWSNDGQYLLAGISDKINVLNIKTGRHLGDLVGPLGGVRGMLFLPNGGQLVAGGGAGRFCFWDFDGALQQFKEFEASLPK